MKKNNFKFLFLIGFCYISAAFAQDTTGTEQQKYRGGFGIYPMPNKPMLGYRSNLNKRWAFDSKVAYVFQLSPQLTVELNAIRRHVRNDVFNFYNGIGFMLDGFTPGFTIPIGFEIKPFSKYPNIVIVTEASPKLAFSIAGGVYSTLNGNVGVLFFRPAKKSKK
ncbi:MAG: hypothetical protein WAQ28_17970 [Bacteroidia bacterium]|jgi:hypothetical protein